MLTPYERVIKAIGSTGRVARLCNVTRSAVQQWSRNGIPRDHILMLEQATQGSEYPVTAREMLEWGVQLKA